MFNNPIQPSNLFITPTSEQQLADIAFSMSNRNEAWRMIMFTMNYCHQLVESEMRKDTDGRKRIQVVRRPTTPIMSEEERAEIREEELQVLMSYHAPKKNI